MPGISLPSLVGIAGLTPQYALHLANYTDTDYHTVNLFTVPSRKMALITHAAFRGQSYGFAEFQFQLYGGGLGATYYFFGALSVDAMDTRAMHLLLPVRPGITIRAQFALSTQPSYVMIFLSYLLFDYYGDD